MSFTVLPTNIGGVNLNSITGPLSSLIGPTNTAQNLVWPSDLGSNPSMGHAVIFTAFDYQTGLGNALKSLASGSLSQIESGLISAGASALSAGGSLASSATNLDLTAAGSAVDKLTTELGNSAIGKVAINSITASGYKPLTPGKPLATISLFMPENLSVQYSSTYGEVSLTDELGLKGMAGSAYSDIKANGLKEGITPYAKAAGAKLFGAAMGGNLGGLAAQSLGVFTNPQIQLLYKGIGLRTFQLQFTLTPKSSSEAQVVKNICDSFAYFSLPGISGAQVGNTGQFLTPPQVFKVQFKFLGQNGIVGSVANIFNNALTSSGLGFLTNLSNPTDTISSGAAAKTFTVNDCVLEDVIIDYAPMGWATYNDGYPVQTQLTLQFKETTMVTKDQFKGSQVSSNYNNAQFMGPGIDAEVAKLGGTRSDFMTGSNGFGNYGE